MIDLNLYEVVLFDFDGTLVDTMGRFADLAGSLISNEHELTLEEGRQAYLRTSGVPFFAQLAILFPQCPSNDRLVEEFETRKLAYYSGLDFLPDVPQAIEALRAGGLKVVISSNNFTDVVTRFLATSDVEFDLVLGFGEGQAKGEPHFDLARRRFGTTRERLLFVGDSVRDAELAEEGQVAFIARLGTVPRDSFLARFGPDPFPFIDALTDLLPCR